MLLVFLNFILNLCNKVDLVVHRLICVSTDDLEDRQTTFILGYDRL